MDLQLATWVKISIITSIGQNSSSGKLLYAHTANKNFRMKNETPVI